MFNSYGNVEDCLFQDNKHTEGQTHNYTYGGGMYVELNSAILQDNASSSNNTLTVKHCTFLANEISLLNQRTRRAQYVHCNSNDNFQGFLRGGGIAVFMRHEIEGATVIIRNVKIEGNKAIWGGGMNLHFCNRAHHNEVRIENVTISENSCEHYGGGGVDIGFTYDSNITRENSLTFQNCTFELNKAFFGGGVALYIIEHRRHRDSVTFSNCSWRQNSAHYGAAIDMAPQLIQPLLHVHMTNITFRNSNFEKNVIDSMPNMTNEERPNYATYYHHSEFNTNKHGTGRGTFLVAGLKVDLREMRET